MRKLFAGIAIGIGAASLVLLIAWPGWLDTAELKTYDWRMRRVADIRMARHQPLVDSNIVLVEINDASIRELAPLVGRWPWPRALHAMMIDFLGRAKPKVIAFDVGFWEPEREAKYLFLDREITSAQSDQELADAVRRAGNVVMLANTVEAGMDDGTVEQQAWQAPSYRLGPAVEARPLVMLPYPALASAAAGFGHNFIVIDADGPARRFPPFVRQADRYMPSLGVAAALAAGGFRPEDVVLEGDSIRVHWQTCAGGF